MSTVEFSRSLPVTGTYDLAVCGAGPAGCAAALAARSAGLSVLLVEAQGQLGGMATSGLVSHWLGGRTKEGRWVVGGVFRHLAEEAHRRGIALLPRVEDGQQYTPHGWILGLAHGVPLDPHGIAAMLDEEMAAAGVDALLLTQVADVLVEGDRIRHLILSNKSGLQAVAARAVVDASGDADLAARSGCQVICGREDDGLMTPVTLEFHVNNVDQDALASYIETHKSPRFRELIIDLRTRGVWNFPYDIFICAQLHEKGTMMINTPRTCDVDGTDGASVSDGMRRGRAEVMELFGIMRAHFPGFAAARLKAVAPLLGVRETRRIVGSYVLTVEDLLHGRSFVDTIALSAYGWDLPDPKRPSHQPMHGKRLPTPAFKPIPYRVMVPQPVENLICPGRAVSVERDVLGPLRVMAPCMGMGEAAGWAAAQVVDADLTFSSVDVEQLQRQLLEQGAILEMD
jgi:FAD-dependent oxidoreductase family protein